MNSIKETSQMKDRKAILSTLWIFITVNYIFCDLLSNMMPEFLKQLYTQNSACRMNLVLNIQPSITRIRGTVPGRFYA